MSKNFFPQRGKVTPKIYVYEIVEATNRKGLLKIGYTTRDVKQRVKEQLKTSGLKYNILLEEDAIKEDGTFFTDHEIHSYLRKKGFSNPDGEWFRCSIKDISSAIIAIKKGFENVDNRSLDFKMRPEQQRAVEKTIEYFKSFKSDPANKGKTPRFLWNAKMRFGKTFATYQLAKKQNWKKVLILTFKKRVLCI